ncbi:MAG: GGDEF domain-containing protein [Sphingomonadaceae bacterium]
MDTPPNAALTDLLMRDIVLSENGIAVLDPLNLFLFHNPAFAGMFGFPGQSMVGRSYADLMEHVYVQGTGPRIQAATLPEWLALVNSKHRSARFRSFEVDLVDGRWLLLTEQVHAGGELVMLCSDVTHQKQVELELLAAQGELERLAHTDELTGVPNRRQFLSVLDSELLRARRYHHPLCLAMLDLDHFKGINDRYGHAGGDQVLRHFTSFLRQHLRAVDVLGRLGGEEFALLLPETHSDEALFVLRRIMEQLAQAPLDQLAPGLRYTFSGGLVMLSEQDPASAEWMLAQADGAMYRAKNAGRNRIELADTRDLTF